MFVVSVGAAIAITVIAMGVFFAIFCVALVTDNEHIAMIEASNVVYGTKDGLPDPYVEGYKEAQKRGFFAVLGYELRNF